MIEHDENPRDEIPDTFINNFRKYLRKLEREISGQLKDETVCCDISAVQCHTLLEIAEMGTVTVSQLALHFDLDRSTLSRTIEKLLSMNLITRQENPEDRRFSNVSLTTDGIKEVERINLLCNRHYRKLLLNIPVERLGGLIESVIMLAESMEKVRNEEKSCCTDENI